MVNLLTPLAALLSLLHKGEEDTPYTYCTINSELQSKMNSKTYTEFDIIVDLPSHTEQVMEYVYKEETDYDLGHRAELMEKYFKESVKEDQEPFLEFLRKSGKEESTEAFWIVNRVAVSGVNSYLINELSEVETKVPCEIREQVEVSGEAATGDNTATAQWGVKKIGANLVWHKTKGKGVIVANIDTGVNGKHEALRENYANKWLDAVDSRNKNPVDENGHGTHVMGTICGTKNGIGVAPEAKWIACRALDAKGAGKESKLLACGQWILKEKPDVVCNSWGGGSGKTFFNEVAGKWKDVGIIAIWSIGNQGPACRSAGSPGDQLGHWSVGNVDRNDNIHKTSSRGPSSTKGLQKPEVSAPGTDIVSAWFNSSTSYHTLTGTSMAAPHVAGAVALMKALDRSLTEEKALTRLKKTAAQPSINTNDAQKRKDLACKAPPKGAQYPNAAYGFGRINVAKALNI